MLKFYFDKSKLIFDLYSEVPTSGKGSGRNFVDWKMFGWFNSTFALAGGNPAHAATINRMPIIETVNFDIYQKYADYNKSMNT